jgi:hypothetical protein
LKRGEPRKTRKTRKRRTRKGRVQDGNHLDVVDLQNPMPVT